MKKAGTVFNQYAHNNYFLTVSELKEQINVLEAVISYLAARKDCDLMCSALERDLYTLEMMKKARIKE